MPGTSSRTATDFAVSSGFTRDRRSESGRDRRQRSSNITATTDCLRATSFRAREPAAFCCAPTAVVRKLRSIVRGRLLTLGHNQASVRWQSDALSTASGSVVAFFAYSRGNGNVSLLVDGTPALDFRLSPESEFQAEAAEMRLCYQVRAPRGDNAYGGYVITLAHPAPSPLTLEARYVSGMSLAPKFFTVDEYPSTEALDELLDACGVSADPDGFAGANRLLDAAQNSYPQDTGRWTVANVY